MMRAGTLAFALFVVSLAVPAGSSFAYAASSDVAVSVLGVEAGDNTPDSVAAAITDALRQRVSGSKGFRLVPGRDLMEVKLVFSCPDEAPSCMSSVAKTLGATKLIFGSVKKAGEGYIVTLKMLDSGRQAVDAWVSEQISRAQATGPAIKGPVQKWFTSLTGQGANGTIKVVADVVGASILLDGIPVGVTTADPLTLSSIPAGRHNVTISKPGLEPVKRDLDVRPGETEQVAVNLGTGPVSGASVLPSASATDATPGVQGSAGEVPSSDQGGGSSALKIAAISTLVVGAAGIGFGVYSGLQVLSIDKDLDPLRRFKCPDGTENGCYADGKPAPAYKPGDLDNVNRLKDDGKRFQMYQWIGYGVGAAALGVGGYLFYKAYFADDSSGGTAPQASVDRRRAPAKRLFLIQPHVAPGLAGVGAAMTF